MICVDCSVEAAPKYLEHCPRCGGELAEPVLKTHYVFEDVKISFGGIDLTGIITNVRYDID